MCSIGIVTVAAAAGSVGSVAFYLTTTITSQLGATFTAEGREKAVKELDKKIRDRHKHYAEEMWPTVRDLSQFPGEPAFQNPEGTSLLLATYKTRLDAISDKLASGGIFSRLSPSSQRSELTRLYNDLLDMDANTLTTSTSAGKAIEELIQGKRQKVTLRLEKSDGELTELNLSLVPTPQVGSESSN